MTVAEIKRGTRSDPILSKVLRYTKRGWPLGKPRQHLKPYYDRRLELSASAVCEPLKREQASITDFNDHSDFTIK